MKAIITLSIFVFVFGISSFGQYTGNNGNVAAFKYVEASDSISGYGPQKAVDTLSGTFWSVPGSAPAWILIDLESSYYMDGISIEVPDPLSLPSSITLQLSKDGSTWIDKQIISIDADGTYDFDIEHYAPIQLVRLNITEKDATASISEIEVYGMEIPGPEVPVPLEATEVGIHEFTANWSPVEDAYGYKLYVATDAAMTDRLPNYSGVDIGNVTSFDVIGLDPAFTYYYRVKAYNVNETSEWSHAISVTTLMYDQEISFDALESKTYGDPSFILSASTNAGLKVVFSSTDETVAAIDGDTVYLLASGTCNILANQAGNDTVNSAAEVSHTLVIDSKTLLVTGTVVVDKIYDGNSDAQLSGSTLEGAVAGDDVHLNFDLTGSFSQSNAGNAIAVIAHLELDGSDKANYELTPLTDLTGNILKKELSVAADNLQRDFCEANPTYTMVFDGFITGEDESYLEVAPEISCEATNDSPAGEYDILISGGADENYSFTYTSGILTILPDNTAPELSVHSIDVQLDAETAQVEITPDMVIVMAKDDCGIVETVLSKSVFTAEHLGDNVITVTVSDAAGNSTSANATVTVSAPSGVSNSYHSGIRAYPNPTRGKLQLEFETIPNSLRVMDMSGKLVLELTSLRQEELIEMSEMNNGIYLINVSYDDRDEYFKIIKH